MAHYQHIYNLAAIKNRMQSPPKAQRLEDFFNREKSGTLTNEELEDLQSVLNEGHDEMIDRIEKLKS